MEVVKKLYEKNIPVQDIAKQLGCAISTVSGYIKELGLREKKKSQINKEILEMYKTGKTIEQICFLIDVSRGYVCELLKKHRLNKNHYVVYERELTDKNTVYAENKIELKKEEHGGKSYVNINDLIIPR